MGINNTNHDGTDSLCLALYGRVAEQKDYIGGLNTKMLNDAAAVVAAARGIRHWHDSGDEGMVVSADHVRALWDALPPEVQGDTGKESADKEVQLITLELDSDGYPTDKTLKEIEQIVVIYTLDQLMDCLAPAFEDYGKCERQDGGLWVICTGGWSGCEDIIHALQKNPYIWSVYWRLSRGGGYFEFAPNDWSEE